VALVVYAKITLFGLSWQAIALATMALLSITAGTLYQKHFCPQFDLRTGTVIQFSASFAAVLPFALLLEDVTAIAWTPQLIGAWAWSVLALPSARSSSCLPLIRRSDATQVTSLLYLTPPTTALMAWAMFGETLSWRGLAGMVLAVIGVIFVVKQPR
jgi:drug/metabolite transporter (DMT)-like permease